MRHLRIFCSICYKHIPVERRKKLNDRSKTLIFVGYHLTGAYRLYDPEKRQMISRDVLIDESTLFRWGDAETYPTGQPDAIVTTWLGEKNIEEVEQISVNEDVDTRRLVRTRFPSIRLAGHELFSDNDITDSGDGVYYALLAGAETISWEQTIKIKEWKETMLEELSAIERNMTWKLVELPQHKRAIEVQWVFKSKSINQMKVLQSLKLGWSRKVSCRNPG